MSMKSWILWQRLSRMPMTIANNAWVTPNKMGSIEESILFISLIYAIYASIG